MSFVHQISKMGRWISLYFIVYTNNTLIVPVSDKSTTSFELIRALLENFLTLNRGKLPVIESRSR